MPKVGVLSFGSFSPSDRESEPDFGSTAKVTDCLAWFEDWALITSNMIERRLQ